MDYCYHLNAKTMIFQHSIGLCLTALHSKPKLDYLEVYLNPVYLAGFINNLQALKVFSSFLLRYMIRMEKYSYSL